jgi:hypothetical protein
VFDSPSSSSSTFGLSIFVSALGCSVLVVLYCFEDVPLSHGIHESAPVLLFVCEPSSQDVHSKFP